MAVTATSGTVGGTRRLPPRATGARCIVVARPAEGGGALSLSKWKTRLREFAR